MLFAFLGPFLGKICLRHGQIYAVFHLGLFLSAKLLGEKFFFFFLVFTEGLKF